MLRTVSSDSTRARDAAQIALDEGDVGRIDGDVGPGAHRDPNVRPGQRRGIVDAVARHGDRFALRLLLFDQRQFVLRPDLAVNLRNTELRGDRFRRRHAVARRPSP